jgi:hypothetical protein
MKNLSIFILTSTFILASCGGGDIKIEDEYRELNKKLTKLKGSERDGMSRKQQENYDIELANIKKLREEYVNSLLGIKHSGKCFLDSVKKSEWVDIKDSTSGALVRSIEVFEKEFTLLQGYSEEQMVENANHWRVTCREFKQPSDERGLFDRDKRGSEYTFTIHDNFLTEEERKTLDNIKSGERLYYTGVIYYSEIRVPLSVSALSFITGVSIDDVPFSGLNLTFKNQPWDIEKLVTKNTEKTIFFDN